MFEGNLKDTFHANSLDSLANSSNQSESLSDDSHDSDSGAETKAKNSFAVKCEVYSQSGCGSIRSWTKSDCNSESSYEYVGNEKRDCDKRLDSRMETIPEEIEPKVSVKAILARFENLNDKKEKDYNNNSNNININNNSYNNQQKRKEHHSVITTPASSIFSSSSSCSSNNSSTDSTSSNNDVKKKIIITAINEENKVIFVILSLFKVRVILKSWIKIFRLRSDIHLIFKKARTRSHIKYFYV